MSKVKVSATAQGLVIVPSENSIGYGYIRIEQDRAFVNDKNWVSVNKVSTLLYGTIEDLSRFGYTAGMELPGKILIKESLEPFNTENPEKDYKIAGKTGIVCCLDGQPIYRKTFYNASGTENDIFIAHNNGNAIKAAIKDNQEEVVETTEATEEFSL
jgi:hypothetical protein